MKTEKAARTMRWRTGSWSALSGCCFAIELVSIIFYLTWYHTVPKGLSRSVLIGTGIRIDCKGAIVMSDKLVLVTGAAGGRQGQSGRHLTELLLARGVPVRAFVHQIDERSDRLRSLGAEVVEGDFLDFPSVERAVRGVSTVYFAYPVQAGLLDATAIMAAAARKAGVTRLIDMVMLLSSPDAPAPRARQNY